MVELIKVNSARLLMVFFVFASCKSNFKNKDKSFISFASVLDKDLCTIYINDVKYYDNKPIITDRSLGIDSDYYLIHTTSENEANLKISFRGVIIPEVNTDDTREVTLDTIINIKRGNYFLITARIDEIEIIQSKKRIQLD